MKDEQEIEKIGTVLFGRKTCGRCVDKESELKKQNRSYKYVSADSAAGKKWLNKHGITELPALRVCKRSKDGIKQCYVLSGKVRKKEKK
jgi:hypothetical protein